MDPAAAGGEVRPGTSEVNLLTDRRFYDVTLADGLEKEETDAFYRHLQPDVNCKIKYRIQLRRKDATIIRLTSRAQHDERRSTQDRSTRQRRLRHLSNI